MEKRGKVGQIRKKKKQRIVQKRENCLELCEMSENCVVPPQLSADHFPPLLTVSDPILLSVYHVYNHNDNDNDNEDDNDDDNGNDNYDDNDMC